MILFKVERCCRILLLWYFSVLLFPLVEAHSEMGLFTANAISSIIVVQLFRLALLFFSPSLAAHRKQTQRVPADRIRYSDTRTTTRLLACMSAKRMFVVLKHERGGGNSISTFRCWCVCDFCLTRMMVRLDSKCSFRATRSDAMYSRIGNVYVFVIYSLFGSQFRLRSDGKIMRSIVLAKYSREKVRRWHRCEQRLIGDFIAQTRIRHSKCLSFCSGCWNLVGVSFRCRCIRFVCGTYSVDDAFYFIPNSIFCMAQMRFWFGEIKSKKSRSNWHMFDCSKFFFLSKINAFDGCQSTSCKEFRELDSHSVFLE